MRELSLGDLFRYSIPGAVFLVAARVMYPSLLPLGHADRSFFDATVLIALALTCGALIQAAHRAVPFVLVHKVLLHYLKVQPRPTFRQELNVLRPTLAEVNSYRNHLELGHDKARQHRKQWLGRWADQTHLLWGGFWALVLARFLPALTPHELRAGYGSVVLVMALLLLIAAIVDTFRQGFFSHEFYAGRSKDV